MFYCRNTCSYFGFVKMRSILKSPRIRHQILSHVSKTPHNTGLSSNVWNSTKSSRLTSPVTSRPLSMNVFNSPGVPVDFVASHLVWFSIAFKILLFLFLIEKLGLNFIVEKKWASGDWSSSLANPSGGSEEVITDLQVNYRSLRSLLLKFNGYIMNTLFFGIEERNLPRKNWTCLCSTNQEKFKSLRVYLAAALGPWWCSLISWTINSFKLWFGYWLWQISTWK